MLYIMIKKYTNKKENRQQKAKKKNPGDQPHYDLKAWLKRCVFSLYA